MEYFNNQAAENSEQNEPLLNPPNVEKPLENLYKTIKRLQKYCITINTQPNIAWKNFMEVYRLCLDAPQDTSLNKLLSEKNQQLQLRELTGEYLDNIGPMMLQTFEEIQNFSQIFSSCYEDFQRGIQETTKGSPDQDYSVVINYLLDEIKKNLNENKNRDEKLTAFSKKIEVTYESLYLLKIHTEHFFDEQLEEIKRLEKELSDLEDTEDKDIAKAIAVSYLTKKIVKFPLGNKEKNSSKKDSDTDAEKEQLEKNKQALKDKIKKLKQKLANYDSDFANLITILKACSQFRSGLFSLRKDVLQTKHTWDSLAAFLMFVETVLGDVNTQKEWIITTLIPTLSKLNDYFIGLDKTITDIKKILPMEITITEENQEDRLVASAKVPNITMLNYHIKKTTSQ